MTKLPNFSHAAMENESSLSDTFANGFNASLASRFQAVRDQTFALVQGLSEEDCALQSMPDASPTKWHLAHTSWFFEVFVLEKFETPFKPFDSAFRLLFNSYYDSIGENYQRAQRGLISRPSLGKVQEYRHNVNDRIQALLRQGPHSQRLARLVELGIQHEQQHQELLLTDLKHLFSLNPLKPAYREGWPLVSVTRAPFQWLGFSGGLVTIGQPEPTVNDVSSFCFDNETPQHQVFVQPFELASEPILNVDVIDFINEGGYRRSALWLSMGWEWVMSHARTAPQYWEPSGRSWTTYSLRGQCKVSEDVPATHLSYFEADAIARWRGARLPTEAEWELAARATPPTGNFLESGVYHPLALQSVPEPDQNGFVQLWGDNWEWTQSQYSSYPGFQPQHGALGEYNGKFMCNQFVLRGGSCATPQSHIRASYRNFFPPHATWQFSGARLAKTLS